jgi:hypothetical protein
MQGTYFSIFQLLLKKKSISNHRRLQSAIIWFLNINETFCASSYVNKIRRFKSTTLWTKGQIIRSHTIQKINDWVKQEIYRKQQFVIVGLNEVSLCTNKTWSW